MSAFSLTCRDLPFTIGHRLHELMTQRNHAAALYELDSIVHGIRATVDDHVAEASAELYPGTTHTIEVRFVHKNTTRWVKHFNLKFHSGDAQISEIQ